MNFFQANTLDGALRHVRLDEPSRAYAGMTKVPYAPFLKIIWPGLPLKSL